MFQQKGIFTCVREGNVSGEQGIEPESARVQGEMGENG